jgi:hypothetical protein
MRSRTTAFRRTTLVVCVTIGLLGGVVPQAQATIYTGACAFNVNFVFDSPVRATGTAPTYTIGTSTLAPCVITLDALEPTRRSSVDANGSSSIWTCNATLASGRWDQAWTDSHGNPSPPAILGSHLITGTWGAWTMKVQNPSLSFVGVMPLTIGPGSATSLAQCLTSGVSVIHMVGVLVFQDP